MRHRTTSGTKPNTEAYPGDLEARFETVDPHGAGLANHWAAKGLTQEQIERATVKERLEMKVA